MRSAEWNPRTKKEEAIVGGLFDKGGEVVKDQVQIPTDIMVPLGTLSNLLNPAVAKHDEKRWRSSPEEREQLIGANLGQLKRAVAYWTGNESIGDALTLPKIQEAMAHVHEGGRIVRTFARSLVSETTVPYEMRDAAITTLTKSQKFRSILQMVPNTPQYESRDAVAGKVVERALEIVTQKLLEKEYVKDAASLWREGVPETWKIKRYLTMAQKENTGLTGVADRLMFKIGASGILKETYDGAFKFPSDALVNRLEAAQRFYKASRNREVFVLDAPFKNREESTRSVGFSSSKLLVALSPEYEEMNEGSMPLTSLIGRLKDDLADAVLYAASLNHIKPKPEQISALNRLVGGIDEKLVRKVYAEAAKSARASKREELSVEKKHDDPELPVEPVSPDDFARLQSKFLASLIASLRNEQGDFETFVSSITHGRVKGLKVTGVWRDRGVSEIVASLEDGADIGRERARVEQLLNNLPRLAALATRRRGSPDEKARLQILGQALYELSAEMREKRLHDTRTAEEGEKVSAARETALQNQEFAKTYRMFLEYGLLPPRPESLEIAEREENQTEEEYSRIVTEALAAREQAAKEDELRFRTERNRALFEHLTSFLERMDDSKPLRGNMVARIGGILGASGTKLKELVRTRMQEIESRPAEERFNHGEKVPNWNWSDWDPYVVYDEKTGRLLQPPEQMRASIEKAEELVVTVDESLKAVREEFDELHIKTRLPGATVDEIDVNKLNVLEHKCLDPFALLIRTQQALKRFGTDPQSLRYKSTKTSIDRLNGRIERIRDMRYGFESMRKDMLVKFVEQTRALINAEDKDPEENAELLSRLVELEYAARTGSANEVRQALNFFMYTE